MDIFCIRRRSGFLSIADFRFLPNMEDDDKITAKYICSSLITKEEEYDIKVSVMSGINKRISYWIQEKRYVRRIVICALIFLLLYLLCSIVIRDPIPLLDELLIALAGSAAMWFVIARHDVQAKEASRLRDMWEQALDEGEIVYSSPLSDAEEYMAAIEKMPIKSLIDKMVGNSLFEFEGERDKGLETALLSRLELSRKLERRYIKAIQEGKESRKKLSRSILQDCSSGSLDLEFMAFCMGYCKKVEK